MIDTVKILINVSDPIRFTDRWFSPISLSQLVHSRGYGKTFLNPPKAYERTGIYMPRLTMYKRINKFGSPIYQLAVEFSAPKMLFGNNFNELQEADFDSLIAKLQSALYELIGIKFFSAQLAHAEVSAWHPSKNIVFLDYTSCQSVLNVVGKLDVSRVYDFQKTDFRDGHVVHIHTNSLDIAMYDKMADLRKAKKSDKRALEKNSRIQLNLLELLPEYRPMEVFRYEVRLVGKRSVKQAFPHLDSFTFEDLFKKDLSQGLLIKHWQKITQNVDMLALDASKPLALLQNYIESNPNATPQNALAAVGGLFIAEEAGCSGLRNTLEARFGSHTWHRLKPMLKVPQAYRFKAFVKIDEDLARFTPTNIDGFVNNVDNNGNLW